MNKILTVALLAMLTASAGIAQTGEPTLATLNRDLRELSERVRKDRDQMTDLLERVTRLEQRMGDSYRAPSPFTTVERRLDDLEKDVNRLKR